MIDQGAQSVRKRHASDKRNDLFIGGEASPFPVFHKRHEPVRLRGVDGVMYDLRNEQNHHEKHRFDLYGDFRQRNEINQGEKRLAEDMPCGDSALYRMFVRKKHRDELKSAPERYERRQNSRQRVGKSDICRKTRKINRSDGNRNKIFQSRFDNIHDATETIPVVARFPSDLHLNRPIFFTDQSIL